MSVQIRNMILFGLLSTAGVAGQECEIPDYPNAENVAELGLTWCPAEVSLQVRAFALQAAGAQCALTTGSSSTPDQIQARRQEIRTACEILAGLGVSHCQCPPGFPVAPRQRVPVPPALASLPPEMTADRYLLQADELMGANDFPAALDKMDQILALQKEHNLTLPADFHFQYARGAMGAGSFLAAMTAAARYLETAGRQGEHYREALKLLNQAETIQTRLDQFPIQVKQLMAAKDQAGARELVEDVVSLQKEYNLTLPENFLSKDVQIRIAAQSCQGQPKGTSCWMELANQPGCYVWNPHLQPDATVTWTGECVESLAQRTGTLKWDWDGGKESLESTGLLKEGKGHGPWVLRSADGDVHEGPYVDGKLHGRWVGRFANGTVKEGPFVEGKQHGRWVERFANGGVQEGPFVEGKRHGQWVLRFANGTVEEGPFVEGKRHGQWVLQFADGNVSEGPFVEGKRHGQWVVRFANGAVAKGTYVKGKGPGRVDTFDRSGEVVGYTLMKDDD